MEELTANFRVATEIDRTNLEEKQLMQTVCTVLYKFNLLLKNTRSSNFSSYFREFFKFDEIAKTISITNCKHYLSSFEDFLKQQWVQTNLFWFPFS
jgi:hypothetical protein